MPWKRFVTGLEQIVGTPGADGLTVDQDRLDAIRDLMRRMGVSRLRPRDITDAYLTLVPQKKRRGKGVYYTPHRVVEFILDQVLPPPRIGKRRKDPYPLGFRVLEPACGAGYFLLAAFSRLRESYRRAGFKPGDTLRTILEERLAGIDIDPGALLVAMSALLQEAGDDKPQPTLKKSRASPIPISHRTKRMIKRKGPKRPREKHEVIPSLMSIRGLRR